MTAHEVLLLTGNSTPHCKEGIDQFAAASGWLLHTASVSAPPKRCRVDGALVLMDGDTAAPTVARLLRRKIPVVAVGEECPSLALPRVTGDDFAIGRLAATHFSGPRFRHAVFFSVTEGPYHQTRLAGFKDAWRGETFARWSWPAENGGHAASDLKRMQRWLIGKLRKAPKPLAVFAWNDYDAVHVLNACRAAGVDVPSEVAILGVDNYTSICENQHVSLSSVAHDLKRIGHTAAALLERLMSGGQPVRPVTRIKPQGVVARASTDPLAACHPETRAAIAYIDGHLSVPFGAGDIAAALEMPRTRLDRLFAKEIGHSVGTEIARRRITRAKELLRTSEGSIDAIASDCGYCNRSFFIKRFRQATGTTPLAWRKTAR